jgi:hypothetical protein
MTPRQTNQENPMTTVTPIVKDCHACHGATVVRVRYVDNKHGHVRVVTCPDCKGVGSWISGQGRHLAPVGYDETVALLQQFAEWRDAQPLGSVNTAEEFLAQRDMRARPAVEDVPQAC